MGITIKSKSEIETMRGAGKIVADTLSLLIEKIKPGVTTKELDAAAEEYIAKQGSVPSFKNYHGYPASICASINDVVVHGIPNGRVLKEGDIISLDVGAIYRGFHGDSAVTVPVGRVAPETERLLEVGARSLEMGIAQARAGNHLSDISAAVQRYVEDNGFSVVRDYVGHGIGREMHEDPQIPNFGAPGRGPVLRPGMTLALEPMINVGGHEVKTLPDNWTVATVDGKLSAHFEHTVAVTNGEPEILTKR